MAEQSGLFGALFPQRALFGALLSCDDHRKILEEYIPLTYLNDLFLSTDLYIHNTIIEKHNNLMILDISAI